MINIIEIVILSLFKILQVNATDNDEGNNGQILFSIGDDNVFFIIDKLSKSTLNSEILLFNVIK